MRIISEKEVCERLNIGRTKFWQIRKEGRFPQPTDHGYVDRWVDDYISRLISEAESCQGGEVAA